MDAIDTGIRISVLDEHDVAELPTSGHLNDCHEPGSMKLCIPGAGHHLPQISGSLEIRKRRPAVQIAKNRFRKRSASAASPRCVPPWMRPITVST